jgi:Domain of unknown function (DUF4893)
VSTPKVLLLGVAFLMLATAAEAGWQDDATPFDQNRLAKLDEARAKGLAEAERGADVEKIRAVLEAGVMPMSDNDLSGNWRCRTMKLGGMTPDVVYGWFDCRVTYKSDGLYFEKLSGSQRMSGRLYARGEGSYVFLGATSVKGEPMHRYSGNHETAGAQATPDDVVGVLTTTGLNRARIEFPYPVQESTFDVIELKR